MDCSFVSTSFFCVQRIHAETYSIFGSASQLIILQQYACWPVKIVFSKWQMDTSSTDLVNSMCSHSHCPQISLIWSKFEPKPDDL